MNLATSKSVNNLTIILISTFFIYLLIRTLIIGGRWDLNEQIAFGQRLISGVSAYANGQDDLFFPSSPYFPGVGYLSYFYHIFGLTDVKINNQFMLFTAIAIGFSYFMMLYKLTLLIYPKISRGVILTLLTIFFTNYLPSYINYMQEFKPDTIMLLLGLIILFLLEKKEKISIIRFILIGLLLFITTFFKQSFFLIYFLAYLLIFFHNTITNKQKVGLISTYSLLGVIGLFIIFNNKNIYFFTIEIMSQHPILNIKAILNYLGDGIKTNFFLCFALLYFFYKRYKFFVLNKLESKYFTFAFIWFLFSILSTAKLGGNTGNYEVGLIVFIPFAIFAINDIFQIFYKDKYFNYFIIFVLTIGIIAYSYKLFKIIPILLDKINQDKISVRYITKNFKGKNTFIDGNTYIVAKKAELNILTELETIGHFNNVPNYDMSILKNAIGQQKYDLIFITRYFSFFEDPEIHKIFSKKYILLNDKNTPTHLVGQLYIQSKGK